jgi:hypothetical protein
VTDQTTADAVARLAKLAEFWRGGEEWLARELSADALAAIGRDITALLSRVAECEADAARLDWLEERGVSLVGVSVPLADTGDYSEVWEVRQQVMRGKDELLGWDTTVRLAIDAAREGVRHG